MTRFEETLRQPIIKKTEAPWSFIVLPKSVSETLPRRGRTSVKGTLNGHDFVATLEPDGQLSHWLRVDQALGDAAGVSPGDRVTLEVAPVEEEPEPEVPAEFQAALNASPAALETWQSTTTLARVDWIHWMTSAKQQKTRAKRLTSACDMLAEGKQRVCCFDPSGHYSKSLSAPKEVQR